MRNFVHKTGQLSVILGSLATQTPNPQSQDAVIRAVAQNLAIEAKQTSEEYQKSWGDTTAQIRAIFEQTQKKKKDDRDRRLMGE